MLTCHFPGTPSQALLVVTLVRMSQFVRDKTLISESGVERQQVPALIYRV